MQVISSFIQFNTEFGDTSSLLKFDFNQNPKCLAIQLSALYS